MGTETRLWGRKRHLHCYGVGNARKLYLLHTLYRVGNLSVSTGNILSEESSKPF